MGSLRGRIMPFRLGRLPLASGVVFLSTTAPAFASICETERPLWTPGSPATALDEFYHLAMSPASLLLLALTILAVRFRSQWGGLIVVVLWSLLVSMLAFGWGPQSHVEALQAARLEGCAGSPALFIGLVAAICLAMILYTTPPQRRDTSQE